MIFNSYAFLIFFGIFLPTFYLLKGRYRLYFTLFASYVFYGWWDWRFLGLIAFSTITDFYLAQWIEENENQKVRHRLLVISLVLNLATLGFFKYYNFFADSLNDLLTLLGITPPSFVLNIILPVGISFYTFQSLSYTIDVYYRKIKPEQSLLKYSAFIAFFPQLVAGPIVRAGDFLPQLKDNDRKAVKQNILEGFDLIAAGFLKKVVIADSIAPVVEGAFASPEANTSLSLIICLILYSFQIYCDFSGYSDIAIGLAKTLGYKFPINFNMPYISASFSEFWTRWHVSLSSWLRDYLYIPLGGSKQGKFNTYKNLMITMLLGGLWHGANWTFIFWGFLHGALLIIQRLLTALLSRFRFYSNWSDSALFKFVCILAVYISVCITWVFFRSPDFKTASLYLQGIVSFDDLSFNSVFNKFLVIKGLCLIVILFAVELLLRNVPVSKKFNEHPMLRLLFYASSIWTISLLGTFSENQFIYFQF